MKQKLMQLVVVVMSALFLANCATPTGTPEQQAAQTRANADMARSVGQGVLGAGIGIGAALLGNGLGNNLSHRSYGPHYVPYRRTYYRSPAPYYYNPYGW